MLHHLRNVCNICTTKLLRNNQQVASFKTRNDGRKVGRKEMIKSLPVEDDGSFGEKIRNLNDFYMYPGSSIEKHVINEMPYKTIPIINIKVSKNNTILNFTDMYGTPKILHSSGIEGFKNCKKGTNIAAQSTAITLGSKVLETGTKYVRVKLSGLGPGRMSAVKGLQMAGLNIVSLTDDTKVTWNPLRAKKQRKL